MKHLDLVTLNLFAIRIERVGRFKKEQNFFMQRLRILLFP
uniref:Uncharacterized protein n=1 Tax=Rhizophora mucronata TaxID=61149 RepID=A0A2P2KMU7_RHIMU